MMQSRIISTTSDGGVEVLCPAPEIHAIMTRGGGFFDNHAKGVMGAIKYEIDKQIAHGRNERVTKKFIHALAFGGLTDAEFFELIRDRDVPKDRTGCELWHVSELPKDYWFFDAWRRSHNGGPIEIDLEKARLIQIRKVDRRINELNKDGRGPLMKFITPKMEKLRFNLKAMATKIGEARDEYELRSVWPDLFVK